MRYSRLGVWSLGLFAGALVIGLFLATRPELTESELKREGIVNFPGPARETSPNRLRIATYNIGYASGTKNNLPLPLSRAEVEDNLAQMITALSPLHLDIIGLQEVDFDARRTFHINEFETLARALEMPYAAYVITWNRHYVAWPYWPPAIHFGSIVSGQAVLSRYPIVEHKTTRFPKPNRNPFWYNWFYLDRIVQEVTIQLGDRRAVVWNVHLEAFDPQTRREQARQLAQRTNDSSTPLKWVIGDFNSVSQVRPDLSLVQRQTLEDSGEALRDILTRTGLRNAETSPHDFTSTSWEPIKKIDHILYADQAAALTQSGVIYPLPASDHLPFWAEFSFLEQPHCWRIEP